jgi:hypothetical protein
MAVGSSRIADGILDRTATPDGHELALHHRNGIFTVRIDGHELISSRGRGSEEALADLGCRWLGDTPRPQVLIGGLGIGYTLRAALDRLPRRAEVTVVELFTHVVRWNRGATSMPWWRSNATDFTRYSSTWTTAPKRPWWAATDGCTTSRGSCV